MLEQKTFVRRSNCASSQLSLQENKPYLIVAFSCYVDLKDGDSFATKTAASQWQLVWDRDTSKALSWFNIEYKRYVQAIFELSANDIVQANLQLRSLASSLLLLLVP